MREIYFVVFFSIYLRHSLGTIGSEKITVILQLYMTVSMIVRSKFLLDMALFFWYKAVSCLYVPFWSIYLRRNCVC